MARNQDLNQWAKLGAAARLKEIQDELAAIYRAYPEFKGQRVGEVASSRDLRKRGRSPAEGKGAISEGMRKYWARRKARAARAAGKS